MPLLDHRSPVPVAETLTPHPIRQHRLDLIETRLPPRTARLSSGVAAICVSRRGPLHNDRFFHDTLRWHIRGTAQHDSSASSHLAAALNVDMIHPMNP
jgi:hypothetical protein